MINIFVAPIAGVTDLSYRRILKEFSPDMMFTEMVSSNAVVMNNKKTKNDILRVLEGDAVQIFGRDIEVMVKTAKYLEEYGIKHIDVNMGCPVPKIIKNGYGAALLDDPEHIKRLVFTLKEKINTDLSIKIRIGYKDFKEPLKIAKIAEEANLKFITVHGRTKEQMYSGTADWDIIKMIKENISIPVIGNGDIFTAEAAFEKANYSGVDGIMVARGIFGNPWLIKQIREKFTSGRIETVPSSIDKIEMALKHLEFTKLDYVERQGVIELRKHVCWYIKGLPNSNTIKDEINKLITYEEVEKKLLEYKNEIMAETI